MAFSHEQEITVTVVDPSEVTVALVLYDTPLGIVDQGAVPGPQGEPGGLNDGFEDYNDAGTLATPVVLAPGVWTTLPNDGAGPQTVLTYSPPNVTKLLDTATGALCLVDLGLGDEITLRYDFTITPSIDGSSVDFRLVLGDGLFDLPKALNTLSSSAGVAYRIAGSTEFYVGSDIVRTGAGTLQVRCSGAATLVNNGAYIQVKKLA